MPMDNNILKEILAETQKGNRKLQEKIEIQNALLEQLLKDTTRNFTKLAALFSPNLIGASRDMNTRLISSPSEPVYAKIVPDQTQPEYIVDVTNTNCALQGMFYSISTPAVNILTQQYMALQINTPLISTKSVFLGQSAGYSVTQQGNGYIQTDVYRDGTVSGTMTDLTPHNTNFGFSDASVAAVGYLTSSTKPVTGTSISTIIDASSSPIILDFSGLYIFPPGHNMTLLIYNNNNHPCTLVVSLTWMEM